MLEKYRDFLGQIDTASMLQNTAALYKRESGVTFPCYHASAQKTLEILQQNNFQNVEIISFKADGKSDYQDKITPIGWDAHIGKITVVSSARMKAGEVIADYEEHPFHLIKGSTSTAPGGELMRIITFDQLMSGEDAHDALVMLPENGLAGIKSLSTILDYGAKGFINDFSANALEAPDELAWCNACTEYGTWHVTADDRPFIGFCVTPNMGRRLRSAVNFGDVAVNVECDGRRYETTIDMVTATVPGHRKEEFWLMAHLYEPLSNDNSSGVAAVIETARLIRTQGTPEFTVRLVFAMEHYGFAAYAAYRGNCNLSSQVIGAMNYDAMYLRKEWSISFNCGSPSVGFYGNFFRKMLIDDLQNEKNIPQITVTDSSSAMYDDDTCLGDSTIGIPVLWPIRRGHSFWHNSTQVMTYIEPEAYSVGCALMATVADAIVNPSQSVLQRAAEVASSLLKDELAMSVGSAKEHLACRYAILMRDAASFNRCFAAEEVKSLQESITACYNLFSKNLEDDIPHSPWRIFAEKIIPSRLTVGFPFDLAKLPPAKRRRLPGDTIYGPFANILADLDGKRTLAEAIRLAEHETRKAMDECDVKKMVNAVFYLADAGYLSLGDFKGFNQADVENLLRSAGIKSGDFIIFHSSLSAFGRIEGGAATVIAALKAVLGPEGTCLCPALRSCFAYLGGPTRGNWHNIPYDENNAASIWTGSVPRYLWTHGAIHSSHCTHAFCGWGPLAEEACSRQGRFDAPVGKTSPLYTALEHHGKIVHFGNGIGSTTFLHCIEDDLNLPGVQNCLVKISKPNGYFYTAMVPRNLPGHRDFYKEDEDKIKFFVRAKQAGLEIRKANLGLGTVKVLDMVQLNEIGTRLAKEDPYIFLCDSPRCLSCTRLKNQA